ncbi:MAG TPA: metallophosphoesterase family protein [Kofleriaceae bacterium]|nr:metallophosphoesterase family protein [Kofleriaceae bacterium]
MARTCFVAAALLVGCGGPNDAGPDAAPVYNGGSIEIPGCGYTVTTPMGATAPEMGSSVFGVDPTPRMIHLGLTGDPRTTMVASWRTMDETTAATTIKYGKGTALDQTATGITFTYEADFSGKVIPRVHEAHLCGLDPDTTYSYQVGSIEANGTEHLSPTYQFRTAPDVTADPSAQVVIGVVGDCRGAYDVWGQIIEQVQAKSPDLILFSGDMVELGQIQTNWDAFFEAAEPLLTKVPMVSALGNHEVNAVNYYAQLALPGDEEDYSLDYGRAHIVVLNDSPDDISEIAGKAKTFLSSDLAAHSTATWKLALHHRALYSSSTHGSQTDLQQAWGPIYDQYGVDFVLNGHDHDYERSKPLKAGAVQASMADGTVYLVQGGAGADLYPAGTNAFTELSDSSHGATVLTIGPSRLDAVVFRETGATIDSFSKTK